MTMMEDIAIVGFGAMLPEANNSNTFWNNLLTARCAIHEIPDEIWEKDFYFSTDPKATDKSATSWAAFVTDEDITHASNRLNLPRNKYNRLQIMTLSAAEEAFAQLLLPSDVRGRSAIYLGCMSVAEEVSRLRFVSDEWESLNQYVKNAFPEESKQILPKLWGHIGKWSPNAQRDLPHLFTSSILSYLQERYQLNGEAALVDAACASSLAAIDLSMRALRSGRVDFAVSGGIDASLNPVSFVLFSCLGALAPERCQPFDQRSAGLSQGEGAVVLALERLSDAKRLDHEVHAIIKGCGGSSDGKNSSLFAPTVDGQLRAFCQAYGNMDVALVDYVECHGTGTALGDATELESVVKFFGENRLPIGSVKSLLGHTKGAAGAVSVVKCILSMKNRMLPPSPYCTQPLLTDERGPYVNRVPIKLRAKGAPLTYGVSGFGFGGINYHLVLQEYDPAHSYPKKMPDIQPHNKIMLVGQWKSPLRRNWDDLVDTLRIPQRSLGQIDTVQLAALAAAITAFKDLHIDPDSLDRNAVNVISASTLGLDLSFSVSNRVLHFELDPALKQFGAEIAAKVIAHKECHPIVGEDSAPGSLNNVIAGRVTNYFNFTGLSFNIDADLASFPVALSMADLLLSGQDGLVILLGRDETYDPEHFAVKCGGVYCWLLASLNFAKKFDLPIEAQLSHIVRL